MTPHLDNSAASSVGGQQICCELLGRDVELDSEFEWVLVWIVHEFQRRISAEIRSLFSLA